MINSESRKIGKSVNRENMGYAHIEISENLRYEETRAHKVTDEE